MICNAHNSLIITPPPQTGPDCIEGNSNDVELPDALLDTPIRRYLNLDHFIDMMECERLYVNRRRVFSDKKERYLPFSWPGFMMPVGDNLPPQPDKTEYWKSVRNIYSKWASFPTICWTLTTQESYLMWKGYTDEIGICIVSSIGRFLNSILDGKDFHKSKCIVHCGQMIYNGYFSMNMEEMPFWKGVEYVSENELRFYFEIKDDTNEDTHIYIPINYSTLIDKIIISPFVCSKTATALSEMISERYKISVSLSKIQSK